MQQTPSSNLDMDYLKSDDIGKVLAKGLAQVYKVKPQFPVDFLAKWLMNYSQSKTNEDKLDVQMQQKEQLRKKEQLTNAERKINEDQKKKKAEVIKSEEDNFKQLIQNDSFHLNLLCRQFCDFLVNKHGGMTGVYVGYVDHPNKTMNEHDDDELAHLDLAAPKVINYIGSCQSHTKFMLGKTLSLELGVTAEVFKEPPPVEENLPEGEVPEPPKIMSVYIPSVVHEPRMVYFLWPKLGAYFAVPLIYNSCLFDQALDSGVEERLKYRKALAEQLKEKESKEADFQERIRLAQEQGEDFETIQEEYNTYKVEWVEIQEAEFAYQKREYVVCFDTLGQDREISPESRKYFQDYVLLFARKWEEKEKQLLSKDIDQMIQYYEQVNPRERSEALNLAEDQAVDANAHKFEELRDKDKEYQLELQSIRLGVLTQQITDPNLFTEFLQLKDMRVFKFPGILQALLLFLDHDKNDINKENTNILDWEKVKPFVNESLFDKIALYNHRGPKTEKVKPYATLNRIARRLDKYDIETVENYNVCYGKILKWLQLVIQLRKTDVEIRRAKIEERRSLREQRIAEVERMKEEKARLLDEHKSSITPEELEQFSQEDWEAAYNIEHILPEIPMEVQDDIDEDYDE